MKRYSVRKKEETARRITLEILDQLLKPWNDPPRLRVRLWEGTVWPDAEVQAPATVVLRHPGALRAMFLPGDEVGLAEAYLFDDFDIEGSVEAVVDTFLQAAGPEGPSLFQRLRAARNLHRLPADTIHPWLQEHGQQRLKRGRARLSGRSHSKRRDREAIGFHYDVSNEFYALWLDPLMVYSCAYFQTPDDSLERAQTAKLDYICRKLRLKPGQRLLDIGCGWGGLVIHAAQHFGVDATGITLSRLQAEWADARIREAGLADRCRVRVADYREVDEREAYDALVSVGMFEHVGENMLPVYFRHALKLLRPGGVFLNHGIAKRPFPKKQIGGEFIDTYVFPDGELLPISTALAAAEHAGFEVRDVESLREHYMLTLRHWVARLEAHHEEALRYVQEPTYRVWRLFMAGSACGFRRGLINVYQALLVRQDEEGASGLPLTRADWYVSAR